MVALLTRHQKHAIKRALAELRRLSPEERARPDFLIVGGQKCGTSSLFLYLIRHGSYLRPLLKDIYYFDRHYERGLEWYLRHFPSLKEMDRRAREAGGRVVTGEGATHYLLNPWAAERAFRAFPDLKIVALLRDPAQRAISHFYHNRRVGRELLDNPLDAFKRETERIGADGERMRSDPRFYSADYHEFSYLTRGRYAEQLARWYAHFPRERVMVVCSETFFADTDEVFRGICRFLGIREKSLPAYPVEGSNSRRRDDEAALRFAADYFRPHNAALWELLGQRWQWTA
jgi:hypothetical protein